MIREFDVNFSLWECVSYNLKPRNFCLVPFEGEGIILRRCLYLDDSYKHVIGWQMNDALERICKEAVYNGLIEALYSHFPEMTMDEAPRPEQAEIRTEHQRIRVYSVTATLVRSV
jgi:hypothetical protein